MFDAVVACLVFEHIDEVDAAIAEVARVLMPGGRFCFFLNHPLLQTPDSGWIDDQIVEPPEQYWRIGRYLEEAETMEEVELGVHIRFVHRPLSRYVNALATHGLYVEQMVEPSPPPGFLALAPEYTEAATVPRLLYLRCRRRQRLRRVAEPLHGVVTGCPRSASQPLSTRCMAGEPRIGSAGLAQFGGMEDERVGLRPAQRAVRTDLMLEGGDLVELGVVAAVDHQVGDRAVAIDLADLDNGVGPERLQRVVAVDLASVQVASSQSRRARATSHRLS